MRLELKGNCQIVVMNIWTNADLDTQAFSDGEKDGDEFKYPLEDDIKIISTINKGVIGEGSHII